MKHIILYITLISFILVFNRCSEEDFNSKYEDPSKVTIISVPNLMTGVMQREKEYSLMQYYRYFSFDTQFVGKFAQTFGFSASTGMYEPGYAQFVEGQWARFYRTMSNYIMLVAEYEKLAEAEKPSYEIFMLAAKTHLYDWLLACVDLFGDMPFSEACTLPLTSDVVASMPKYDTAADIYSTVLDELKACAERFHNPNLIKIAKFNTQDFVNWGDVDKWARYANSIRLRGALRISQHGPLVEKGRAAIKEILENPTQYPLVDSNDKNIFIVNQDAGELNFDGGGGLGDWTSCRMASGAIVDRMLSNGNYDKAKPSSGTFVAGVDDPRLPLLFTMRTGTRTEGAQEYTLVDTATVKPLYFVGVDVSRTALDPEYYDDSGNSEVVQNGFFWQNRRWDHFLMTASEMLFAKAEAYYRGWGVAKDDAKAEEAFKAAISQSIKMYYKYNENSTGAKTTALATPNDATINAFANARWASSLNPAIPYASADPKLDAILTQKWLHWGIFFSREAWSQIRRTGYPKLVYPNSGGIIDWVPDRWRYPIEERNYNPNYPGFSNDTYYGILFWADPKGMRHSTNTGGNWTDQY